MSKNNVIIITAIIALIVGFFVSWLIFGNNSNEHNHETHQHTDKETVWTCSMHPQIRQNEPGSCPICGMDLIPLEQEEENSEIDANAINMSPTAMQLANVQTAIVESGNNIVKEIRLNGKIQADERLVYSQTSHIPGRIERQLVNFEGEYVSKGQIIAYVYSPELTLAQEELLEAKKMRDIDPQLYNASKEKLKNWKLTDNQISKIINTGKVQEQFPIIADATGYVINKKVNNGDHIKQGESLYEIVDLSRIWVMFDVYESDMQWVKKGDTINFTIESFPGESFSGTISYIDPFINPNTRVAKARVVVNNSNMKLKPEMFVSGVLDAKIGTNSDAIYVPKSAVMWTGKKSVVYVKNETDNKVSFILREVTLGGDLGDSYIIKDGLNIGEEIAVNGTFSIDAAAQLAGKNSMMSPEQKTHQHTNRQHMNTQTTVQYKKELASVFNAYFSWKNALTQDNIDKSIKHSKELKSSLEKLNDKIFTEKELSIWVNYKKDLLKNLEHVHHIKTIEESRKMFQKVSVVMINIATKFKAGNETIYVQHCPMADNNKGADWLSKDKKILNPFFGQSMLGCGEVIKEIK